MAFRVGLPASAQPTVLVDVSFGTFTQVWGNTKKAKQRYDTYQSIRKTLCKTGEVIGKYGKLNGHHTRPKYMDGPDVSGNIEILAETIHRQLHQVVKILHRLNGLNVYSGNSYSNLSPDDKNSALKILYETTKSFDKACESVKGYKPIAPILKSYL